MEQPKIVARKKPVLEVDGLQFKDLNKNGKLDPYEDWRLSPEERAEDLIRQMTLEEKLGLFIICDKQMGKSVKDKTQTSHDGILSEVEQMRESGPFEGMMEYGTTKMIKEMHIRHIILREKYKPSDLATWINTLNEVAEGTRLGIPVIVASNSRNENDRVTFDDRDRTTSFTAWPGTLGIAATGDLDVVKEFAETGRKEWNATNIRKGYMYMADTATDPRWYRITETFGEHPDFISKVMETVIEAYQGEELGEDSIALTIKHFPGGGARENGFDPHYEEGKYNVCPTPGSLEKYHLPPFIAAIKKQPSSIMPYYAIPSNNKSASPQAPFDGPFEEVGFAYNKGFITDLLREKLGFKGYVNSDTGILTKMAWGVEKLTEAERVARALAAGTDLISGHNEIAPFKDAYEQGLLTEEMIDRTAKRLLKEMFALGMFENPYRDPEVADQVVNTEESRKLAYKAHQKSVVLLKNKDNLLPLTPEKLTGKKVYVELFMKTLNEEELERQKMTGITLDSRELMAQFSERMKAAYPDITFIDDYHEADYALLFLEPKSGFYFKATDDYLELNIGEETGIDLEKIKSIRTTVPKVIINIDIDLPWILTNIEPLADCLLAGFNTFARATMDIILGKFNPTGKLPLTLPAGDEVIAVDENGICASPNDVPGYDKHKYMDGKEYAYRDEKGNQYKYGFGLRYEE